MSSAVYYLKCTDCAYIEKRCKNIRETIAAVAIIDESNDPGSRVHGKYYIMAATVMDPNKLYAFAEITEEYNDTNEMKFNTHERYRYPILERIAKLDPRIYSISVRKPKTKWTGKEQNNVHKRMLYDLVRLIAKKERTKTIHIIVDENDRISVPKVKKIAAEVSRRSKKNVTASVAMSENDHALQTNDFIIGSIGKMHNRKDRRYIKKLGIVPRNKRLIVFGIKEPTFIRGRSDGK